MNYYFPIAFCVIFLSFFLFAQSLQPLRLVNSPGGVCMKIDNQNDLLQSGVPQNFLFDDNRVHRLFGVSAAFLVERYGSCNENLLWHLFSRPMFAATNENQF